jgi:hypothetical protein
VVSPVPCHGRTTRFEEFELRTLSSLLSCYPESAKTSAGFAVRSANLPANSSVPFDVTCKGDLNDGDEL